MKSFSEISSDNVAILIFHDVGSLCWPARGCPRGGHHSGSFVCRGSCFTGLSALNCIRDFQSWTLKMGGFEKDMWVTRES